MTWVDSGFAIITIIVDDVLSHPIAAAEFDKVLITIQNKATKEKKLDIFSNCEKNKTHTHFG